MDTPKLVERAVLTQELARVLEPDAWSEYDREDGRSTGDNGGKIHRSIVDAVLITDYLSQRGPLLVPLSSSVGFPFQELAVSR